MLNHRALAIAYVMLTSSVGAAPLAMTGGVGADLPLSRRSQQDPGVSIEGAFRQDPYELRFHYGHTTLNSYSVLLAIKYFFNQGVVRPYIEGALGPTIVDTPHQGLAYGVRAEPSLGADFAANAHMSFGAAFRYYGQGYFGDTNNGNFEANHGFSLLGHFTIWF